MTSSTIQLSNLLKQKIQVFFLKKTLKNQPPEVNKLLKKLRN